MIKYNDIKTKFNHTEYLLDFLNDYYFYSIDGNINDKTFTSEELQEMLNEDYLSDNISEFADGVPSVYTYDLLGRLKDNYESYDDVVNDFGCQGGLMENITFAWYIDVQNKLNNEIEEFIEGFDLDIQF